MTYVLVHPSHDAVLVGILEGVEDEVALVVGKAVVGASHLFDRRERILKSIRLAYYVIEMLDEITLTSRTVRAESRAAFQCDSTRMPVSNTVMKISRLEKDTGVTLQRLEGHVGD